MTEGEQGVVAVEKNAFSTKTVEEGVLYTLEVYDRAGEFHSLARGEGLYIEGLIAGDASGELEIR